MDEMNTVTPRDALEQKYNNSRTNLLLIVAFSIINIVLLVTKSDTYFLFSAFIPYMLAFLGMFLCGKYPLEYYGEEIFEMEFLNPSVFAVFLGLAFVFVALYFLSWIFSKKNRVGWLIFALVFFSVDTLAMFVLQGISLDSIIDIAIHIWVIVSLSLGINAGCKIKKMPAEEESEAPIEDAPAAEEPAATENLEIIRVADMTVKARILLKSEAYGHTVIYRRVKRVNELVVDGNVYDEIAGLVEFAHTLKAEIDGHLIEACFDGVAHSILKVDGAVIAKKLRLF